MNVEAQRGMRPSIKLKDIENADDKALLETIGMKLHEGQEVSPEKAKELKEAAKEIAKKTKEEGASDDAIDSGEEHKALRDKAKELFGAIPMGTASIETGAFGKDKSLEDLDKSLGSIGMNLPKDEADKLKDIPADKREAFEKAAKEISPKFGSKEKIDDPEEIKELREKAKELLGAEPVMMRAMMSIRALMTPMEDELVLKKPKKEGEQPTALAAGDTLDVEGKTRNLDLFTKNGFSEADMKGSNPPLLDKDGKLTEDGAKMLDIISSGGSNMSIHDLGAVLEKNGGDAKKTLEALMTKAKEPEMDRDKLLNAVGVKPEDLPEFVDKKVGGERKRDESFIKNDKKD